MYSLTRKLSIFALLSSFYVVTEPAPYDAIMIVLLVISLSLINKKGMSVLAIVALFIALQFLSSFFSEDIKSSFSYNFVTAYLIISSLSFVFLLQHTTEYNKLIINLLDMYVVAAVFSAGVAITYSWLGFGGDLFGRPMAFFKDPNVMSAFCVPPLIYSGYKCMSKPSLLWLITSGALFFVIILALSRAAIINLVASIFFISILSKLFAKTGNKLNKKLLVLPLLVLLAATFFLLENNSDIVLRVIERAELKSYDSDRFGGHLSSISQASAFGSGAATSENLIGQSTHSLYFRQLYEHGVVGLFLLLMLLLTPLLMCVVAAFKAPLEKIQIIIIGFYCGQLVNSIVIDSIHWRHLWFIWALVTFYALNKCFLKKAYSR